VLWFLVLDTQPATAATETGPHAANKSEPLVVDVAEYDDFVSSLLNQFYLVCNHLPEKQLFWLVVTNLMRETYGNDDLK